MRTIHAFQQHLCDNYSDVTVAARVEILDQTEDVKPMELSTSYENIRGWGTSQTHLQIKQALRNYGSSRAQGLNVRLSLLRGACLSSLGACLNSDTESRIMFPFNAYSSSTASPLGRGAGKLILLATCFDKGERDPSGRSQCRVDSAFTEGRRVRTHWKARRLCISSSLPRAPDWNDGAVWTPVKCALLEPVRYSFLCCLCYCLDDAPAFPRVRQYKKRRVCNRKIKMEVDMKALSPDSGYKQTFGEIRLQSSGF